MRERLRTTSSALGWLALALGILPLVIAVIGKGFHLSKPVFWGDSFLTTVWLTALFAGLAAGVLSRFANRAHGVLRVEGKSFLVGSRRVEASDVASAMVHPKGRVALQLKSGEEIVATVEPNNSARELLEKAGLPFQHRTARTRIAKSMRWPVAFSIMACSFLAGPVLLPIGKESPFGALAWFAIVLSAFASGMFTTSTYDVTVGVDGIHLRKLGKTKFIPFADVIAVHPYLNGISLEHRDGRDEKIRLFTVATGTRNAQRDAILGSVREALEHREEAKSESTVAMNAIARGARAIKEWRASIAELVRGGSYRSAHLPVEELTRVLAQADATNEERIAAALAIKASGDVEAEQHVRIAAQASADPKVRIALEHVVDDAAEVDAAIEEALASASAEKA